MSLKLFRSTEFAESSLFSPSVQRIAIHPFWVAGLASAWLVTACNLVLWRELQRLPETDSAHGLWFGLRLGVSIFAVLCALLSLITWRWSFKPGITVLLVMAAFGTHLMLTHKLVIDATVFDQLFQSRARTTQIIFSGSFVITMLLLAVLPAVWLWRTPVRRFPEWHSLFQNALFFVASCMVLAAMTLMSTPDIWQLIREHTPLRQMINPLNTLSLMAGILQR
jgi:lipid A ethanolaminephosphotransferase